MISSSQVEKRETTIKETTLFHPLCIIIVLYKWFQKIFHPFIHQPVMDPERGIAGVLFETVRVEYSPGHAQ